MPAFPGWGMPLQIPPGYWGETTHRGVGTETGVVGHQLSQYDRSLLTLALPVVRRELTKEFVGQATAVDALIGPLQDAAYFPQSKRLLLGALAFSGPRGVGKTRIPLRFVECLNAQITEKNNKGDSRLRGERGSESEVLQFHLIEIDCNSLHQSAIGVVPPEVAMIKALLDVRNNPNAVVVFRNYSRSIPELEPHFSSIVKDGLIYGPDGTPVKFNRCLIVVEFSPETTDSREMGFHAILSGRSKSCTEAENTVPAELAPLITPVKFRSFTTAEGVTLASQRIDTAISALKGIKVNLTITVDPKVAEFIASKGISDSTGAHQLEAALQIYLLTPLRQKIAELMANQNPVSINVVMGIRAPRIRVKPATN